jgi:hypothetical protein
VAACCSPGDLGVLRTVLELAGSLSPMSSAERDAAVAEVAGETLIFPMPGAEQ